MGTHMEFSFCLQEGKLHFFNLWSSADVSVSPWLTDICPAASCLYLHGTDFSIHIRFCLRQRVDSRSLTAQVGESSACPHFPKVRAPFPATFHEQKNTTENVTVPWGHRQLLSYFTPLGYKHLTPDVHGIFHSQNHKTVWVGKDLQRPSSTTPLQRAGTSFYRELLTSLIIFQLTSNYV